MPETKELLFWRHFESSDLSSLENTGTLVFLLASLALLLYVLVFGTLLLVSDPEDVVAFTSIEWLVKLAIIGLVVGFTTRAKHWSVLLFGLFLICVLILPAKDVARYILIWSEREPEFRSLYDQVEPGLNLSGRERELANEIIHELESHNDIEVQIRSVESRKAIREVIVEKIRRETLAMLRDRLQANGTLAALRVLGGEDGAELGLLRYRDNDRFITEVRFLRSVGLVIFPYDDVDAVQLTRLGEDVLRPPTEQEPAGGGNSALVDRIARGGLDCPVGVDSAPTSDLAELTTGRDLRLSEHSRSLLRLPLTEGKYEITVNGSEIDPVFVFYEYTDDGCSFLGWNDDGGDGLNARREFGLQEDGEYVIVVWSIDQSGPGKVTVKDLAS